MLLVHAPICLKVQRHINSSDQDEAVVMVEEVVELGHSYFDIISNEQRVQFHIDYWNHIGPGKIEATRSIRVLSMARPIMIVGQQDESVFAQYRLLGAKTWIGPKGQQPLLPKSEGDRYMLLALFHESLDLGGC